jgi:hypothetical protein
LLGVTSNVISSFSILISVAALASHAANFRVNGYPGEYRKRNAGKDETTGNDKEEIEEINNVQLWSIPQRLGRPLVGPVKPHASIKSGNLDASANRMTQATMPTTYPTGENRPWRSRISIALCRDSFDGNISHA